MTFIRLPTGVYFADFIASVSRFLSMNLATDACTVLTTTAFRIALAIFLAADSASFWAATASYSFRFNSATRYSSSCPRCSTRSWKSLWHSSSRDHSKSVSMMSCFLSKVSLLIVLVNLDSNVATLVAFSSYSAFLNASSASSSSLSRSPWMRMALYFSIISVSWMRTYFCMSNKATMSSRLRSSRSLLRMHLRNWRVRQ